jgi:glycosyltransferase involved in cell wall biosynthesis
MKALFLRTDFFGHVNVGGSFSHTKGFLDGLKQCGHDYLVMSSGRLPVGDESRLRVVPYSGFYRNLPEVLSIAYNSRIVRAARRIIKQEEIDFLYHRHSEFNYSSSLLSREFGIPLVLECNGSEVWVKKNWGKVYFERMLTAAENLQFHAAHIITVVSSALKDDLIRLGVDDAKILVNPNGVDPDVFRPDIDGTEVRTKYDLSNKIIAGFVGTFGAWHGVDVLARAVKSTIQKNSNIHFLVIGEGNLRGEIERIIREDAVTDSVTLTGSVPHEEIPKYLAACDILLSPHVQNSDGTVFFGSPTKLFEYMGMGKAIIASNVGQIGEILTDGVNAALMKHRDHLDLSEHILRLAGDRELRERLGKNARKDATEKFSWRNNAQRVIDAVQPHVKSR